MSVLDRVKNITEICGLLNKWRGVVVLCVLLTSSTAVSQTPDEYQVKAVFIYNFLHFVDWPPESLGAEGEPFVVGVVGKNVFGSSLAEVLKDEMVKGHPVILKHGDNVSEIGKAHVLFVESSYVAGNAKQIQSLMDKPVLTIGETGDFMKFGLVKFFTKEGKIKLEINQEAAAHTGLVISSKLLRLADIYKE